MKHSNWEKTPVLTKHLKLSWIKKKFKGKLVLQCRTRKSYAPKGQISQALWEEVGAT